MGSWVSSRASSQSCSHDEQCCSKGLGTADPRVNLWICGSLGASGMKGEMEKLTQVESIKAKKNLELRLKFLFSQKEPLIL